ncbi:1-deoxy-D-xylulose-5-phosphate reductoisomerase, partial [Cytophagia bacterium CHB2]|nr:1-deoxy-D-xylulose-5-phosphate reductoisomerase [Cytophagia bacterium CHB2]
GSRSAPPCASNSACKLGRSGGTAPAVLNAANEEAVQAFLEERLRFDQIPAMISETLQQHRNGHECNLANVLAADRWARTFVQKTAASLC